VTKVALDHLSGTDPLGQVAAGASDAAVRIAARVKLEQTSWAAAFAASTARGSSSKDLSDVLAAISLLPGQAQIGSLVTGACVSLIRRGDESRITEMADLLERYGDKSLAEDYLNCGQPDLENAGTAWARKRGYNIMPGSGSHRATWGLGK